MPESHASPTHAIRGPALTFTGDAFIDGVQATLRHETDAIVAMSGGKITHFSPASAVQPQLPPGTHI